MPASKYEIIETTITRKEILQTQLAEVQTVRRRDQLDIIIAILGECLEPSKKTHILFSVGLNYYQLSTYLQSLLKFGMVEKTSEPFVGYRTAEKGRLLLQLIGRNISR